MSIGTLKLKQAVRLLSFGTALFVISLAGVSQARAAGAADLFKQGVEALNTGDYPGAITPLKDIVDHYPTEVIYPDAMLALGQAQLAVGEIDNALQNFTKVATTPAYPGDLREMGSYYIGQALFSKGARQTVKADRDKALLQAGEAFGKYLKDYPPAAGDNPTGIFRQEAHYYRMQALYFGGDNAGADKEAATLIAEYPNSEEKGEYYLWSGKIAAASARAVIMKDLTKIDVPLVQQFVAKAFDAFSHVQASPSLAALSNDAQTEIGALEMDYAEVFQGPANKAARSAEFDKAIAAFVKVLPKERILPLEEKNLAEIAGKIRDAALSGNKALYRSLLDRRQRQQAVIDEIKKSPDPAVSAGLRIGEAYVRTDRQNEARTVLRFYGPLAASEEDRKKAGYLTVLTYTLQKNVAKADEALQKQIADFATDPNSKNLRYFIAQTLRQQEEFPAAVEQYKRYIQDAPDGRYYDPAVAELAETMITLKQEAAVVPVLTDFLKKKPASPEAPRAHFLLGRALAAQGKPTEAVAEFRIVLLNAAAEARLRTDSAVQSAAALSQAGSFDLVIALSDEFVPKNISPLASAALLYYKGAAQAQKKYVPGAIAAFEQVLKDYPKEPYAIYAGQQAVQLRISQNELDQALAIAQLLREAAPDSPQAAGAAMVIGQVYEKRADYEKAAATYAPAAAGATPIAPVADAQLAAMWLTAAKALGVYTALGEEDKKLWTQRTDAATAAALDAVNRFPTARAAGRALEGLVAVTILKIDAGVFTLDAGTGFFADQAAKAAAPAKGRYELARAAVIMRRGKAEEAFPLYQKAYADAAILWTPEDLERFGELLLAGKQWETAVAVFTKLKASYTGQGEDRAQAAAAYGLGAAKLGAGDSAAADTFFGELEKNYPWSEKIWEAKLGRGRAAAGRGDQDKAQDYFKQIIMAGASTPEIKAQALLGFAQALEAQGKLFPDAKGDLPNAVNNYKKIDAFYESVPSVAAEGLWRAGQLYEKAGRNAEARDAYALLVKKYKQSSFFAQADERLKALPAAPAK
ncbi:Tetratricopeptide repeat-containing protein [Verrucomicrobium sp. GAS474]|uniref:tetratricopeptide repeat protein n=1 Tax=Verrucomicrobium sp. GAS474 TaxID=1882831 RepID=UPI00087AE8A5|nr:tetratricopeptide repeat protein [Verrucomicrobium sp. GAS474]SDU00175.1 Tetratricopeptide repeat-containing protein [Verrucomicrobium sp. GAS474]